MKKLLVLVVLMLVAMGTAAATNFDGCKGFDTCCYPTCYDNVIVQGGIQSANVVNSNGNTITQTIDQDGYVYGHFNKLVQFDMQSAVVKNSKCGGNEITQYSKQNGRIGDPVGNLLVQFEAQAAKINRGSCNTIDQKSYQNAYLRSWWDMAVQFDVQDAKVKDGSSNKITQYKDQYINVPQTHCEFWWPWACCEDKPCCEEPPCCCR